MVSKISRSVALYVTGVFIALAGAVSAVSVTEGEARAAATAFVVVDPVGSAVLRGRTVSTVYERDGLWIASLSPSGHVILSGSDLADPIVGFSTSDFAEPDPDSPGLIASVRGAEGWYALYAQGESMSRETLETVLARGVTMALREPGQEAREFTLAG